MADKKTTGKKTPEEAAANQAESQKNPGPTSPLAQAFAAVRTPVYAYVASMISPSRRSPDSSPTCVVVPKRPSPMPRAR